MTTAHTGDKTLQHKINRVVNENPEFILAEEAGDPWSQTPRGERGGRGVASDGGGARGLPWPRQRLRGQRLGTQGWHPGNECGLWPLQGLLAAGSGTAAGRWEEQGEGVTAEGQRLRWLTAADGGDGAAAAAAVVVVDNAVGGAVVVGGSAPGGAAQEHHTANDIAVPDKCGFCAPLPYTALSILTTVRKPSVRNKSRGGKKGQYK